MNPLTEYDSPRKFFNHADNGGKAINGFSLCVLGPGIVASIEPASPTPGEVVKLRLDVPAAEAVGPLQTQVADLLERVSQLESAVDTLESTVAALEPYAIAGGRWIVDAIVTTDTDAEHGHLVRVNMAGKAAPDVVIVTLPLSTPATKGRTVAATTTNSGGAEDGSIVRFETRGGQQINAVAGPLNWTGSELHIVFVDNGNGWDILSLV